MQCMMILNHSNKNPSQKFCKNLKNFEKSQKVSKTPKDRSKDMKCMINERENIILEKKNDLEAKDFLGMRFGVRKKGFGR